MHLLVPLAAILTLLGGRSEAAQCACATDSLNLRSGAGTNHGVVATVAPGTCMTYSGHSQHAGSYTWYQLTYNGQTAWAASNWLTPKACGTSSSAKAGTSCYGDVNRLHPTGKASGGVSGSNSDVDFRIRELNGLKTCMDQVARDNCIEASLIGAVASRETNGGASLTADGLGIWDNHGYGIMQCDLYTSGLPCRDCGPRTCCHIEMLVHRKIVPDINYMKTKFPSCSIEQQVQAAIAAYNTGRSRVHSCTNPDTATTGRDYSNDVIARAQRLKNHHGWS